MNWNELIPIIEVCAPIIGALGAFYLRLSYKIDESSKRMEERWEKQRVEDQEHWTSQRKEDQKHWQWLFEWAHHELNTLKSHKNHIGKN